MQLGEHAAQHRLPRQGMGRARPRRPGALRVHHARRRAGRPELGDDPQEARRATGRPSRGSIRPRSRGSRRPASNVSSQDPGIVRNRLKVESTVTNAKAFLAVQREFGSFDAYVWGFVGGAPRVNRRRGAEATCQRARRSRTRSAAISRSAASDSSARRSAMPSCRPSGWSTTTRSTAFGQAAARALTATR